jgi:hypothetical protein
MCTGCGYAIARAKEQAWQRRRQLLLIACALSLLAFLGSGLVLSGLASDLLSNVGLLSFFASGLGMALSLGAARVYRACYEPIGGQEE